MFDQEEFSGNQYVLEEGIYPDLMAMGCSPQTVLKSLRIINTVSKADKYNVSDLPIFFGDNKNDRDGWTTEQVFFVCFFFPYSVAVKCPICSQVLDPCTVFAKKSTSWKQLPGIALLNNSLRRDFCKMN